MRRPADNPFASHRIEALDFEPQGMTWDQIDARLEELRYRACILGQQGSGKTTMLEALAKRLDREGWHVHLRLHHAQRPAVPWGSSLLWGRRDMLLLDGADLLDRAQWMALRALSRRWGGLVVVSHDRVLLPELVTCRTSVELLERLVGQLAPGTPLAEPATVSHARHCGNIREALREAYDRWQEAG